MSSQYTQNVLAYVYGYSRVLTIAIARILVAFALSTAHAAHAALVAHALVHQKQLPPVPCQ